MNLQTQLIIDKFLRRCCKNFTARDVSRLTAEFGGEFKISSKEAQEYLESSPLFFVWKTAATLQGPGFLRESFLA